MNTQEQEELDLALAISLSEQDRKPCSQSDAFLTSNEIPKKNSVSDSQTDSLQLTKFGKRTISSSRLKSDSGERDDISGWHESITGRSLHPLQSPSANIPSDRSRVPVNPSMRQSPPASGIGSPSTLRSFPQRLANQLYSEINQNFIDPFSCACCRRVILGTYLDVNSNRYHPECFRCAGCNGQLLGSHYPKGDPPLPYHKECAEEIFNQRCCICDAVLRGQYLMHPFFEEEVYCTTHEDSRQCFACSRKEPMTSSGTKREGFTELHDGRVSCMDCISTAVVDSEEARPLYLEAIDFMERVLGLQIPLGMRDVPVLAVDLPSLDEQQLGSKTGHTGSESITRGLTLSTIGQVRHISSGTVQLNRSGYFTVAAPTVYHIEQVREVTAVLVLFGLPRDLTASILAHEAMHVWMSLTKSIPYPLPKKVEEGLCQVIANSYLLHLTSASSSSMREGEEGKGETPSGSHREKHATISSALSRLEYCPVISPTSISTSTTSDRLRAYFCNQIETNCSEIYGDGYREAQRCCTELSLEIVLEVVRDSSSLPNI